ncbi:MAG: D-alanyl-D-alanine carboxypeptidase [Hyphomicrobiales bacterium]|nr:D-alanyl-D-alanine carboxypeptidase [Hyphomicrobiales bacterium]
MGVISAMTARSFGGRILRLAAAAVGLALIAAAKPPAKEAANGFEPKADVALLVDDATGAVLYAKNADKSFIPASLTKMMTVAVAARELKEGRLSLDGEFTMSEHAWRTGGAPSHTSSMFAPVNSKVKVSDLFRGIMIQSANDGAIAMAEGIAGTEIAFAELMNKRAAELGMTTTHFGNPSGLPGADNRTSARDLVTLARHLVGQYPEIYKIYSEREFTYNKIRQRNRNPLLDDGIGADGIKTGFLKESGYNLVGSAVQGTQRLYVVIGGAASEKERGEDAKKLIEWGFRTFETVRIYKAGEVIGSGTVFGGATRAVPLVSPSDVDILVPRGKRDKLKARIVYTGPIKAPIEKGRSIGRLQVTNDDKPLVDYEVVAGEAVAVGEIGQRAVDGARELLIGLLRR